MRSWRISSNDFINKINEFLNCYGITSSLYVRVVMIVGFILILIFTFIIVPPVLGQQSDEEWLNKGIDLYEQGDYIAAIHCYDEAIKLDSSSVGAWYNKGLALAIQCKYREAIKAYDKVIELDPNNADVLIKKDEALKAFGNNASVESIHCKADELEYKISTNDSSYYNLPNGLNTYNATPIISDLTPNRTSPQNAGAIIIWITNATDTDGDRVLYRYFLNDRPVNDWEDDCKWTWTTTSDDIGSNRIEVQVRDGRHADSNGLDDVKSTTFTLNGPTSTVKSDILGQVTLTIDMRNKNQSGLAVPGAQIMGHDGNDNSFNEKGDNKGRLTIRGYPGNWSFTASAEGFKTNSWSQAIMDTCTMLVSLEEDDVHLKPALSNQDPVDPIPPKVTLRLQVRKESVNGPIISGAQVLAQDGIGNMFDETTDRGGTVTLIGDPGIWSFTASAGGFKTNSWSQEITNTCTKLAFLERMQVQNAIYSKPNQLSGSQFPSTYNSLWKSRYQNSNRWAAKGTGRFGRG